MRNKDNKNNKGLPVLSRLNLQAIDTALGAYVAG